MKIISSSSEDAVSETAKALSSGSVVVIPTDTVYGIAASIDHPGTIGRIFDIKKRPRSRALPVLVSELDQARGLAIFSDEALEAVKSGWPGSLTVVLHRSEAARQIDLGGDGFSIGLRVPDHSFTLFVIQATGPIAATSANVSGEPVPQSVREISELFGEAVDLYVDGGRLEGSPSRVLSFMEGKRVLRD